ncbi:MAG: LysM peptidoglycan-binding domain-containing protein [Massilia sp.]
MSILSPLSRYALTETASFDDGGGTTILYLRRRFVPQPEAFALLQLYEVKAGDRIDNISAQFLGDPEQFWRICDANRALRPEELVERPGRQLRITLPQGVPGSFGA